MIEQLSKGHERHGRLLTVAMHDPGQEPRSGRVRSVDAGVERHLGSQEGRGDPRHLDGLVEMHGPGGGPAGRGVIGSSTGSRHAGAVELEAEPGQRLEIRRRTSTAFSRRRTKHHGVETPRTAA